MQVILVLQRVLMQHHDVRVIDQRLAGKLMQVRIDFHRHDGGGFLRQHGGERSGPRAHFEHHVVGRDRGGFDQQFDEVQIDQETFGLLSPSVR
jgi:hypothetical protein